MKGRFKVGQDDVASGCAAVVVIMTAEVLVLVVVEVVVDVVL